MKLILLSCALASVAAVSAQTLTAHTTVDDSFHAYLSTSATNPGATPFLSGSYWPTTYTGTAPATPGVTNYLFVDAVNAGGPRMFMGDFQVGSTMLSTDTTHWEVAAYDANGILGAFTRDFDTLGANGDAGTVWGTRPDISDAAEFIWSHEESDHVLFRAAFTLQAVPEPTSIAAFGFGALGLLRRRRKA